MNLSFTSLSNGAMHHLAQRAKHQHVHLFYFVCRKTPGVFALAPPEECRIVLHTTCNFTSLYSYKTKKGNWSSSTSYRPKAHSHYFLTKQEADAAFKIAVEKSKIHYKNQIEMAEAALNALIKY